MYQREKKNTLASECEKVYKELYNEELEEIVSQGVVEGGFFINKKTELWICVYRTKHIWRTQPKWKTFYKFYQKDMEIY